MPKCNEYYRYEFKHTCEFLFIILDYLYKDINNSNSIKVKEKLIKYNISCFSEFYEIIGFIIMPKINHFTSILIGNINDNNEYEYLLCWSRKRRSYKKNRYLWKHIKKL